jgi:hypothetical protein
VKRTSACAYVTALFTAAAAMAQEARDWLDWPYVRPVLVDPAPATRLVSVSLPPDVYHRVRPLLEDLRVIDDSDREVPFLIHVPRGMQRREWRPARMLETSFLPGAYTQAVVDTGLPIQPHNSIELTVRDTDFFAWVEVAASTDASTWRILNDRVPFYRFGTEGHDGTQVLTYSPSTSRFLRLRLLDGARALDLIGGRVSEEIVEEPQRVLLAASLAPAPDPPALHSAWRADFEGGAPPASEVRFTTEEPEFHRPVRVRASDDGRRWRVVGAGEIYRLRRPTGEHENLRVTFDEARTRYLQVEVFNRNDPPLPQLGIELHGVPRRVVFRQEPERRYRVIYGFGQAAAPDYEIGRLVTPADIGAAPAGALGDEAPMPGHPRPLPWSERHVLVLWLALGAAVVVLAGLAIRSIRRSA